MKIIECEQGSPEWHQARLGKVTASRIADVMDRLKNGTPGAKRKTYAKQLLSERLTRLPSDELFVNRAMQWGIDHEDQAAEMYSIIMDAEVENVGLVEHPWIANAAASPDRLVIDDGLIEIKCPMSSTHVETLINHEVPTQYLLQIHWQLACTKRDWCDFVSFDPRMPGDMMLYVKRIYPDHELIDGINAEVEAFLAEIDQAERDLRDRYSLSDAA